MNKLKNIATNPMTKSSRVRRNLGFTLIELLVVVSVLAAIAGMTSVALDGYQQDAEEKLTRVEMQRIANAIRRFKEDTGYWPKTGPFSYSTNHTDVSTTKPVSSYPMSSYRDDYFNDAANFWWLFDQPPVEIGFWDESTGLDLDRKLEENQLWPWNVDIGMGWHGPYISHDSIKAITIDDVQNGCTTFTQNQLQTVVNKPHTSYPDHIVRRFNGLVDRFHQIREKKAGKDYCILTNINIGDINNDGEDDWQYKVAEFSASPYLYETSFTNENNAVCKEDIVAPIDSTVDCIVIRSFGRDGVDNSGSDQSDDIVFVLQVNES